MRFTHTDTVFGPLLSLLLVLVLSAVGLGALALVAWLHAAGAL